MKEIILASGHITQVSDEDYDLLSQFNWFLVGRKGEYVARWGPPNVYMHLVVLERMGLIIPENMEGDHIDRVKLNNQRDNLRIATASANSLNRGTRNDNSSGCKGVSFHRSIGKWIASITINKNRINLGTFQKYEDAVAARKQAEQRYA